MSAEERIRSFLPACGVKGWDSYRGAPITEEVVERACRSLGALATGYTFWPVPCSDGGIVLEGSGEWDGVDLKVEP